jgi:hypothetical protein
LTFKIDGVARSSWHNFTEPLFSFNDSSPTQRDQPVKTEIAIATMTALSGASDDGAAPAVAVVVVDVVVGGVEVSNDVEVSVSTVEVSTVEVSSDAAVRTQHK